MATIAVSIAVHGLKEENCSVEKLYSSVNIKDAKRMVARLMRDLEAGRIEAFTVSRLEELEPQLTV